MPKLTIDYPRRKSFALTDQDLQNLKGLAQSYDVSDSEVIREALHQLFTENGLPVNDTADWYQEQTPTDRLVEALVPKLIDALHDYSKHQNTQEN